MAKRRCTLAASFVVTLAAVPALAGCDDKPKYAPNPPGVETPNPPASRYWMAPVNIVVVLAVPPP